LNISYGRYLLHQRPVTGVGLLDLLFRLPASRDVANQDEYQRSFLGLEDADADLDGKHGAVLAAVGTFQRARLARGDLSPHFSSEPGA
jgi:hypothetical protein